MSGLTQRMLVAPIVLGLVFVGPTKSVPPAQDGAAVNPTGDAADVREVVVERGTEIHLELRDRLSTSTTEAGDRFRARVVDPVIVGAVVAIPADSRVQGRVTSVRDPDESERAGLELEVQTLVVEDRAYHLSGTVTDATPRRSGDPNDGEKAKKIGGGAAAGALLGALVGDDVEGAVIGAAAGAATGSLIYAGTRGTKLTLPAGSRIRVETDERLRIERDV